MLTVKEILQQLKTGKMTKAQALDILEQAKYRDNIPSGSTHRLAAAPLAEPIQRYLIQKLQTILDVEADQFVITENFMDLGIDSTQLIGLVQATENEVGLELYPTLLFEYQNIESLSAFLAQEYHVPFASFLKMDREQAVPPQPETQPTAASIPFISPRATSAAIPFVSTAGSGVRTRKHKDDLLAPSLPKNGSDH
jgi:acyl carrier protein